MKITAILPVSRFNYLPIVIKSLKEQTVSPDNLIIIHEGHISRDALNLATASLGMPVEIVKSRNPTKAESIPDRRRNITNIHTQFQELIGNSDFIFSIEDDGILPPYALEKLLESMTDDVGLVTGVELGRWGVPYVGAWKVDDYTNPSRVTSCENKTNSGEIEEIDAAGLYCALIRGDLYRIHPFTYSNGLGPDINLGLYCRQEGFKNLIDWDIPITHLTEFWGLEATVTPTDRSTRVRMVRHGDAWQVGPVD